MEKQKRKGKGGAEKLRAKTRKILEVDASTCAKITDMFSAVASVSKPTVPDDTLQKQVNIAHGGEVTSHGGTQAEEQVSDSEVKEGQSEQESVIETSSQVELAAEERDREEQAVDYFARPEPAMMQYLQTKGMDILSAHKMVMSTQDALKKMARDFQAVKAAADDFVKWANEKLEQQDEETDMEVEAALPQKRRKKKAMPGEMSQDDTIIDAERAYEICHFWIPKTSLIRNHALPKSALEDLSKCLVKFDDRATVDNLQYELKSLAGQWDKLKESPLDEYVTRTVEDGPDGKEEDMEIINKSCASCKDCPLCCYQILQRFNMLTDAYPLLGLAYKFLLTLSITQVACKRSFSTLKYIKSRLRSSLSASKLEAFMLMATEKDILVVLDTDTVIDRVAEKSKLLRKLLLL
ncbi:hypothetical protein ROHU_010362 [Labeo rohita]|uniref:HAT C-terminal dimerisation domain-containing protein n=1 Tax=Labeo rohita TaxID=84645 RepID=A0A498LWB8_LABRO|nr:hypothetical protein ROHU_010362 [Labeo rohita]